MFIEDIRNDFYNVLLGNRVLLLVHYDVDAICACKILQGLFKCDNISYTLVPVGSISELKTAYEENNEEIKYVVLVNCGGTIDLVDILQPEEEVVFFVLDSHKPTDVCNVYSDGQVRMVYKDSEEEIPDFDDIFKDDDDEEKEEEQSGGREALEAMVERRRERRAWEERRHTLLFNYTQFSYYGKPVSCVALELCVVLSRASTDALWACGVGVTASAALAARSPAAALLDADALQRLTARRAAGGEGEAAVVLQQDAWLPLYREWSLEAALRHAPGLGAALRAYSRAGDTKLRRLLADMGYPLQQARQAFRAMDVELRRGLLAALEAAAGRLALPAPTRATFVLRRPLAPALAALDLVYAVMALIEHESTPRAEGFQLALSALGAGAGDGAARAAGVARARAALAAAARVATAALQARALHLAGPFTYLIVPEGSPDAAAVRGPLWLGVAARWASAAAGGSKPLVASASKDDQNCLLIGIPPRVEQEPRNLFGAAFEQAAAKCGSAVSLDYVDTSVVSLPTHQRTQFLDALTALLA